VRLDLHNHTSFSADGLIAPGDLLETARAKGLHCIAVTDHNTVRGAMQALALSEADSSFPRVIPGVELATEDGEVVGLYVKDEIPKGLSLEDAVSRIRSLGGLVYLPHPYDVFRRGAISRGRRSDAAELCDLVEVANGRALGPRAGIRSSRLAARHARPRGAGSDAHRRQEVGRAWVEVAALPTRETLLELVSKGEVRHSLRFWGYVLNWGSQASSPWTRGWRRITGRLP